VAEWTAQVKEEADKIRGFELNESGLINLFLKKGMPNRLLYFGDVSCRLTSIDLHVAAQKLPLYGKSLFPVELATTDIDIPDAFMLAIDVHGIEIRDKDSGYVRILPSVLACPRPHAFLVFPNGTNRDRLRSFSYKDLGLITYDANSTVINFHERLQRRPLHLKTPLVLPSPRP
jgi:hypothetical protein